MRPAGLRPDTFGFVDDATDSADKPELELKRKSVPEMFGDLFREVGALALVFGILDGIMNHKELESPKDGGAPGLDLTLYLVFVLTIGLGAWVSGMIVERKRKA